MHAEFIKSAVRPADFPPDVGAEAAVVGRSNSGKSSAINALFGSHRVARVSKTPGRTQLINFFSVGADRRCVDLPGYGFARVSANVRRGWEDMMRGYFESRSTLRGLLITIDIRRGIGDLDEQMLDWCTALNIRAAILATKADKLSRSQGLRTAAQMQARAAAWNADVTLFSAPNKTGLEAGRAVLANWLAAGGDAGQS